MLQENGLTYVIFNVSELPLIDFTQVLQTSAETCRKSIDETQTLVKWYTDNGVPTCVQSLTTKSQYYTHDEILEIMSTPEWTQPMPM
jgi:hypothetical protein